ncbi:MAG: hypothetical protein INQ03_20015 [Candidatus Heimdallarchaeota archaeon]|nr:hypothetical protein [Candidatus Heimdallarchaeota archaeon]
MNSATSLPFEELINQDKKLIYTGQTVFNTTIESGKYVILQLEFNETYTFLDINENSVKFKYLNDISFNIYALQNGEMIDPLFESFDLLNKDYSVIQRIDHYNQLSITYTGTLAIETNMISEVEYESGISGFKPKAEFTTGYKEFQENFFSIVFIVSGYIRTPLMFSTTNWKLGENVMNGFTVTDTGLWRNRTTVIASNEYSLYEYDKDTGVLVYHELDLRSSPTTVKENKELKYGLNNETVQVDNIYSSKMEESPISIISIVLAITFSLSHQRKRIHSK